MRVVFRPFPSQNRFPDYSNGPLLWIYHHYFHVCSHYFRWLPYSRWFPFPVGRCIKYSRTPDQNFHRKALKLAWEEYKHILRRFQFILYKILLQNERRCSLECTNHWTSPSKRAKMLAGMANQIIDFLTLHRSKWQFQTAREPNKRNELVETTAQPTK